MSKQNLSDAIPSLLRVGDGFSLADVDPDSTPGFTGDKFEGMKTLEAGRTELSSLQERLYASTRSGERNESVLLVLQAMDTAGKGGIVRRVVGAMDPQGVSVASFKKPTPDELAHDFLWRVEKQLPARGFIGVFDRSHYEDVLIGKVRKLASETEIERRYEAINDFESLVADSGTRIVKVMLHISRDQQRERLAERLNRPDKYWKYNPGDVDERLLWDDYMRAYQAVFERNSTAQSPWYVVPANAKWYARLAVQELLLAELKRIDPQWPEADYDIEAEKRRLAGS
ncbi:PPK2 family polyphosphate kinase [Leucobacter sp. W1478]|uniref:PPK2 family polyphosphate kinase n=1 Tax=Leucobacter sp. W1478 TaxID=3439065 RepID=UPI003F2EA034